MIAHGEFPAVPDAQRELVQAWRILGHYGLVDTIFNHVSVACIDSRGAVAFVMNPRAVLPSALSVQDVVTLSLDRRNCSAVNPDGFTLHAAIQRRRRGTPTAVLHLHGPYTVAVGICPQGLIPATQTAIEFTGDIRYFDYHGVFSVHDTVDAAILDAAADGCVAMLRGHGSLVVSDTLAEAVYLSYYLEEACKIQILAGRMTDADHVIIPSDDIIRRTRQELAATRQVVAREFFDAAAWLVAGRP